jgi:hypothetical protein
MQQLMLIRTKHDPHATERMDIAIADFYFLQRAPNQSSLMRQVSQVNPVRKAHSSKIYSSSQKKMAGLLLDNIYQSTYDEQMRSLLKSKVFGIALFGDGATIQKVPMMIFLGSSPNNPFALLGIVDCTSEMAKGGKKDAKFIMGLLKPIIS